MIVSLQMTWVRLAAAISAIAALIKDNKIYAPVKSKGSEMRIHSARLCLRATQFGAAEPREARMRGKFAIFRERGGM